MSTRKNLSLTFPLSRPLYLHCSQTLHKELIDCGGQPDTNDASSITNGKTKGVLTIVQCIICETGRYMSFIMWRNTRAYGTAIPLSLLELLQLKEIELVLMQYIILEA